MQSAKWWAKNLEVHLSTKKPILMALAANCCVFVVAAVVAVANVAVASLLLSFFSSLLPLLFVISLLLQLWKTCKSGATFRILCFADSPSQSLKSHSPSPSQGNTHFPLILSLSSFATNTHISSYFYKHTHSPFSDPLSLTYTHSFYLIQYHKPTNCLTLSLTRRTHTHTLSNTHYLTTYFSSLAIPPI